MQWLKYAVDNEQGGFSYEQQVKNLKEQTELKDRHNQLSQLAQSLSHHLVLMIQNDPANPNITKLWWDIRQKNESLRGMVCHSMRNYVTNKLHKYCSFQARRNGEGKKWRRGLKQTFVRALEKVLKSFNMEREAYYSSWDFLSIWKEKPTTLAGTFVGNHVHATLKVYYMYTIICCNHVI